MFMGNTSDLDATRFKIYGERCSGTNYIENLISRNVPGLKKEALYNWEKHNFVNPPFARPDTIAVVVFRDAFDWLQSLHRNPHQIPRSFRNKEFSEFIRHEWSGVFNGWLIDKQKQLDVRGMELLFERHPVTGAHIENVLELRNLKNQSYLKVQNLYPKYIFIRYEDASKNPEETVKRITDGFGCTSVDTIHSVTEDVSRNAGAPGGRDRRYAEISEDDRAFILDGLDCELEKRIGYSY